jgi:hypothetical protein
MMNKLKMGAAISGLVLAVGCSDYVGAGGFSCEQNLFLTDVITARNKKGVATMKFINFEYTALTVVGMSPEEGLKAVQTCQEAHGYVNQ